MTAVTDAPAPKATAESGTSHVRGSTLLFVGRLVSLVINFATQIIIARHLGQSEFGAFAFAFAVAGLGQVAITLGLHRGVTRFLTADLESGDHPRLLGTILLNIVVIVGLGAILVAFIALAQDGLTGAGLLEPGAVGVLLILILLAPIDALDDLLISLYAIFDNPSAIFIRRYVLAPMLRLIVALLVVIAGGGAGELAIGYIIASLFGLALYGALFLQLLGRRGIIRSVRGRPLVVPAREVLGASVPLLSTDAVWLLINTFPIFVLTAASGLDEVAAYQVIRPAAALNLLVATSFHVLYLPLATRFANRQDRTGTNELYWGTTIWVSVLTFPVFVATFALAGPLIEIAFGERYATSGTYLSVLAVGYIVHAALGFNSTTLAAYGRQRTVALVNGVTAAISVSAALVLIPIAGALGAAVASTVTLLAQNALLQLGLHRQIGVELVHRDAIRVYVSIAVTAGVVFFIEMFGSIGIWNFALAVLAWPLVLYQARRAMRLESVFPGIHRWIATLVARTGRSGRRIAAGIDLLRSLPLPESYRRARMTRRWMRGGADRRAAVYRAIWTEAAAAIGATIDEASPGRFDVFGGNRHTTVTDHEIQLDRQETLDRVLDKPAATRALRDAGLPVQARLVFRAGDHAAAAAFLGEAGGPCVVKPAYGRNGSGVTTNVRTPGDLVRAVVRASTGGDALISEPQHAGLVYRFLFLDGRLLDVLEQRPPRVTGDGRSTIGALIEAENDQRLAAGGRAGLSRLRVDLDCQLTLAAADLELGSVPPAGTVVEVKATTNQNGATGNRSVFGEVHEDLVAQSRRAVDIVGLRLAGVEVITSDPRVDMATSGAVILEVNGLPGIHYHYLVDPATEHRPVAIPILEALLDPATRAALEAGSDAVGPGLGSGVRESFRPSL
jgi:O-antigen/teichoic acid export membrane protein/D-alanine-D-alanine ligase-like ATP-grasp enzyme